MKPMEPLPLGQGSQGMRALLDALAAPTPTPGGGTAAALAGAMGAALIEMACRLTVNRAHSASTAAEMERTSVEAGWWRHRLAELADEDARIYGQVITAHRLPKATEAEAGARQEAIQAALRQAAWVSGQAALACAAVIELARQVIGQVRRSVRGDVAVGALLAEAGLRGAHLNLEINLSALGDPQWMREEREELAKRLAIVEDERKRIISLILP
ncbi:MAG: cyclodeaminase/cyclohydrolase family protein [Anaerolineae bacterium]|nr:cyclodeaminase/cyclohydrolase family protein [Anaerolineae bacterium]MDW8098651.1 cyclodeaminase/cyclohydrolase family protein [Anaerolineae bacterium]